MNQPVMLRLEIDHIRHQVLHSLMVHHEQIEAEVGKKLQALVESFDYKACILAHAPKLLDEAVREGMKDAIRRVMWDVEFRDGMDRIARDAFRELLKERTA